MVSISKDLVLPAMDRMLLSLFFEAISEKMYYISLFFGAKNRAMGLPVLDRMLLSLIFETKTGAVDQAFCKRASNSCFCMVSAFFPRWI